MGTAQSRETYKKQSGGRGKFACIDVTIGPKDEDYTEGDLQFVNEVKGGNVPKEFIPSVQKGFQDCLKGGVLGGDRKSTRLNSSHANISYAVFCLKKKKQESNRLSKK